MLQIPNDSCASSAARPALPPRAATTIRQPNPNTPTPVAVTETFNGHADTEWRPHARHSSFSTAGQVSVKLSALAPDDTISIGLSLGTWNGAVCSAHLANDNAIAEHHGDRQRRSRPAPSAPASTTSAGSLTASTDYTIDVTHF